MTKRVRRILMIVVLIVIIFFITYMFTIARYKHRRNEDYLYSLLNSITKDFYENYYYPIVLGDNDEDRIKNAESYKSTGITYTLNELVKYKIGEEEEILSKFKNVNTNMPCDYDNSKVTIYPQSPYGSEDIRIESNIVCGFQ